MATLLIRILVTFFFIWSGSNLQAGTTGKIKGRVTDINNQSLVGVNIVLDGTSLGAAADEDGRYYILNVPPGSYTVVFSMIGYKTLKVKMSGFNPILRLNSMPLWKKP